MRDVRRSIAPGVAVVLCSIWLSGNVPYRARSHMCPDYEFKWALLSHARRTICTITYYRILFVCANILRLCATLGAALRLEWQWHYAKVF
jgi:hypothetical protein